MRSLHKGKFVGSTENECITELPKPPILQFSELLDDDLPNLFSTSTGGGAQAHKPSKETHMQLWRQNRLRRRGKDPALRDKQKEYFL
ncbi:MAG: hypothetical protein D6805_02515 [Planctomycetota bacterium]|nr:MAG: hypothetical protein D6805_02515 [Planctomycetota bacterium]